MSFLKKIIKNELNNGQISYINHILDDLNFNSLQQKMEVEVNY